MKRISIICKVVLAILFLICLLDMPYGYYQLIRFLGMIGFGLFAFQAYNRQTKAFFIIWLASAILINPLLKISLGREIWNGVDVIWAVLLFVSIKMENK
jgi:hypothetical protein